MIVGNVLVSRTVCGVTGSSDVKDRDGNPPLEVEIIKVQPSKGSRAQHKVDDRKLEKKLKIVTQMKCLPTSSERSHQSTYFAEKMLLNMTPFILLT